MIFYSEDGEIEYGGSTQNKHKPFFDSKYIIKNYFEGDYKEICKESGLSKAELYWFRIYEKELFESDIKLTHWSYSSPGIHIEIIYLPKKSMTLKKAEQTNVGTFTNFGIKNDQSLIRVDILI